MGKLQTKRAQDIMTSRVHALSAEAPVEDAAHTLLRRGYSGAPVLDKAGRLAGVFSEHDAIRVLAQAVYEGWPAGSVADHMTPEVETVDLRDDLAAVIDRFRTCGHRRLLVMDQATLAGIITRRDLLRALDQLLEKPQAPTTYELIRQRR